MTTEQYLTRMAELEIGRGRLETEFPPDMGSVAAFRGEGIDYTKSVRDRVKPPAQDLSALTPKFFTLDAILQRHGTSVAELSDLCGMSISWLRQSIRGKHCSGPTRARLGRFLSDAAKRELGWEV
jgi:hypothetical protein